MNKEDVYTAEIDELYNYFTTIYDNRDSEQTKVYRRARFGFECRFDINDIIYDNYERKKYDIRVGGRYYNLSDFYTEMEARTKILKEFLLIEMGDEKFVKAGGNE